MAHFAQIDADGKVLRIIVVANAAMLDASGKESELLGAAVCNSICSSQRWVQTSYNGTIRKNFAGIGYTYDEARDAFIPPKPFPSWSLDEATCRWVAPIPRPSDKPTRWDEERQEWVVVSFCSA